MSEMERLVRQEGKKVIGKKNERVTRIVRLRSHHTNGRKKSTKIAECSKRNVLKQCGNVRCHGRDMSFSFTSFCFHITFLARSVSDSFT
jgi:hypothetical protein